LDPLSEDAARALIHRLAAAGDRAAALAVYERLRDRLRTELSIAPSALTRELVAELRVEPGADRPPLPRALARPPRSPLAGRREELARLRAAWRGAAGGARAAALIGGDPGIGKTRLARELAHEVHEAGATVLHGRCHEEALVPYEPFVEALAPVVADRARIEAWAGATAGELGRLFPALGEPPSLAGGDGARHRLFVAVDAVLAALARAAPVLLVLDD